MFEKLVIADGLASVNTILKDKDGFMWFGGTHGLYRYDGYSFKLYSKDAKNPHSISNNNVTALYQDRQGFIWVGTMFGGVNKYDPVNESFENVLNSNISIYDNQHITTISEDNFGNLWVGTFGNGLYQYNEENNSVTKFKAKKDAISNNDIFSIIATDDKVWITSNSGILDCFDNQVNKFYHYIFSQTAFNNTRTGQRMCIDYMNNLWIGTEGKGLYKFSPVSKRFDHFNLSKPNILPIITDLKESVPNEIWITTDGNGIIKYNTSTDHSTYFQYDGYSQNSISNNSQYCIFIDSDKQLWIGMGDGSINRTKNSPFKIYQSSYSDKVNSLSFNVIVSLYMEKNNLWIGTGGGGLDKFNTLDHSFVNYKNFTGYKQNLPSEIIMSTWCDKDGTIWSANFKNGIQYKSKISQNFIRPKVNDWYGLDEALVFDIKNDQSNKLWIATYDKGLYTYDPKTATVKKINSSKIEHLKLLSLFIDSSNNVWIGTASKGVKIYSQRNNFFITDPTFYNKTSFLNNNPVKAIFEDTARNIWIASEGAGLIRISPKQDIDRFTEKDGLPGNSIYGMIQDNEGQIWMSSNKGICYLNPENKQIFTYNTHDGLPTNDFESGSIAKGEDGKLYFGSKNGLVSFYPDLVKKVSSPIHLKITNLKMFNKDVPVKQDIESYKLLDSSIVYKNKLVLPYYLNNFTFEFASPGHEFPYRIKYEYKLNGVDNRWIKALEGHAATYSNISPGHYVFKVRASEENTSANKIMEKQIGITIFPVWWQTNIAYLIYASILAWLIYFLYTNGRNKLRLKNELLIEKYKHEKDEELHQSKLNFFTAVSHELRTSLTLVLAPLSELSKVIESNNRFSNLVMTMERNGKRLLNLTNQILDFRKIESGVVPLEISYVNISSFIKEVCLPFQLLAEEKRVSFTISIQEDTMGWIDTGKLEIILYNILSNAFKFTNSHVTLNVANDNNSLTIKITDNGKGVPDKDIDKIFNDYYQVKTIDNNITNTGTGLGLAITKNLVQLHQGTIRVDSKTGSLTSFSITIPINKSNYKNYQIKEDNQSTITDNEILTDEKIPIENLNADHEEDDPLEGILLVVEDNSEILKLIKHKFENNFQVITANDGKMGYQIALDTIPDIIISDIMMPIMDGLELCKLLKTNEQTSHIPILLLTARASHSYKIEGYQHGADDYLTKPFDLKLLEVRVKNLLTSRKLLRDKFQKQILLKPNDIAINDTDEAFLKKLIEIVENNMGNSNFNVIQLSQEIGMSHSVLYRKIKAMAGENINEFLKSIRLGRSLQLLSESSYTINEISDMTGFSNAKYFSTCFKKKYGKTPTEFRSK